MNPSNYKTGDVFLCTGKSFLSRAIMRVTKSKRSHVALFIEIWGQPYVIDAQKNGVNPKPLKEWQEEYDYNFDVLRPPVEMVQDEKQFSIRAFSKVGLTAYDFMSLIIRHPLRALGNRWKEKRPYDRMTCSEYVVWVFGAERAYRMHPGEVEEWCLQNNFTKI